MRKTLLSAALAAGLIGASVSANAQFQIYMSDDHGNVLVVMDGGIGDVDTTSNAIVIDPTLLNSTFTELSANSVVSAANNLSTGDDYRWLGLTEHLYDESLKGPVVSNVYVSTSATGFGVPFTDPRQLDASASGVFTGSNELTASYNFWGGPNDGLNEQGVAVPGNFYKSAKGGPNFYGGDFGPSYMAYNGQYSMFIESNYKLLRNTSIQSASIITATGTVPEPASMAALAIGGIALLRRRAKKA